MKATKKFYFSRVDLEKKIKNKIRTFIVRQKEMGDVGEILSSIK